MSEKETLIKEWIQNVTKRKFPDDDFMKSLKDGTLLCELVSKVKCRFVAYNKNPRSLEWMEIENLQTFITESQKLGYPKITWKIETVNKCKSKDELCEVIFWLGEFSKKQPKFKGPALDSKNKKKKSNSDEEENDKPKKRDDVKKIEHKRTQSDVVGVYKKTVSTNNLNKRLSSQRALVEDDSDDSDDDDFISKRSSSSRSGFESPISTTSEKKVSTPSKSHLKEMVSSDDEKEDTSKLVNLKEQIKKQKIILAKLKEETDKTSLEHEINSVSPFKSPRKYDDQKVKVLKETFKKQLQEAEEDHKKQIEALKQKYKNEIKDQKKEYLREMKEQKIENIRTFHDLKADLVDKFRTKEEAYENQIKDYKKKLISAEDGEFINKRSSTYTRDLQSNVSPETPTSDTSTPKLISSKKKNSFYSKSLEFDDSDKFSLNDEMDEFGRIVKKDVEDEDLEDEEDLEDNQEEKKSKVLNSLSELRMKVENFEKVLNKRWEDADHFYIIDTLKEILKVKDNQIEAKEQQEIIKELLIKFRQVIFKNELIIHEKDEIEDSDAIDLSTLFNDILVSNSLVNDSLKELIGEKQLQEKDILSKQVSKSKNDDDDDEEDDEEDEESFDKEKLNLSLNLSSLTKLVSSKEIDRNRFSRRFDTISNEKAFFEKTLQTADIPKHITDALRPTFKVTSAESGLGDKTRYFRVDMFQKKLLLLDRKGNKKKEHDINFLLFLEKNLLDNKRLHMTFISGPKLNYEIIFNLPTERELFYQSLSAIRIVTFGWNDYLLDFDKPVTSLTFVDKTYGKTQVYASSEKFEKLKVYCGTWNMGNSPAPTNYKGFDELFPPGMDIYAISFQESDSGITKYVQEYFKGEYFTLASMVLWEIRLIIIAKQEHMPKITNIQQGSKATGFMNVLGNKGGLAVSFMCNETSFCFIGTHLAAHEEKMGQRKQNVIEIVQNLNLGNPDLDITQFDHLFFMGDMNYRIDLPYNIAVNFAQDEKFEELMKYDQLIKERKSGSILSGFTEGALKFKPTFKLQVGKSGTHYTLEKQRTPSYCDRILCKSLPGNQIEQITYKSIPSISTSDHKPVISIYEIGTFRPYLSMFTERQPRREIVFDELYISNRNGSLIKQPTIYIYGDCLFESPIQTKKIKIKATNNPNIGGNSFPTIEPILYNEEYLKRQHLHFVVKDLSLKDQEQIKGQGSLSLEDAVEIPDYFTIPLYLHTKYVGDLSGIVQIRLKKLY